MINKNGIFQNFVLQVCCVRVQSQKASRGSGCPPGLNDPQPAEARQTHLPKRQGKCRSGEVSFTELLNWRSTFSALHQN